MFKNFITFFRGLAKMLGAIIRQDYGRHTWGMVWRQAKSGFYFRDHKSGVLYGKELFDHLISQADAMTDDELEEHLAMEDHKRRVGRELDAQSRGGL